MNRMTGFSAIASWIASRIGLVVGSLMETSFRSRLDRQGVDASAELLTEYVMHEAMLSDARHAGEHGCGDNGVEVVAIAGHHGRRAGDPGLDARLELLRRGGVRGSGH
jgi:hypothetical protein